MTAWHQLVSMLGRGWWVIKDDSLHTAYIGLARATWIAVWLHRVTVFWWHKESFYYLIVMSVEPEFATCSRRHLQLTQTNTIDYWVHFAFVGNVLLAFWCPKSVFGSGSWLRAFSWKRKYWRIIQSPLTKHCYCQLQNLFVQISFSCFVPSKAVLLFGGCPVDRRVMSLPQIIRKTV